MQMICCSFPDAKDKCNAIIKYTQDLNAKKRANPDYAPHGLDVYKADTKLFPNCPPELQSIDDYHEDCSNRNRYT